MSDILRIFLQMKLINAGAISFAKSSQEKICCSKKPLQYLQNFFSVDSHMFSPISIKNIKQPKE